MMEMFNTSNLRACIYAPCTPFSEPRYSTQPHKKTEAY